MAETLFAEAPEDAGSDESYQPLSGLAVAGFMVSWLSVGAFFGAVLWSVAGLAILLNLAALRHVAATSRKGAGLARTGLVVSVVLLSAAVSYDWWREFINRRQAQRVADQWVEAVLSGDLRQAHQLSMPPNRRQTEVQRLAEIYAGSPTLAKDLEGYEQIELVRKLAQVGHGGQSATTSLQSVSQDGDAYREGANLRYELRYYENDEQKIVPLALQLIRERTYAPHLHGWRVNLGNPLASPPELHEHPPKR